VCSLESEKAPLFQTEQMAPLPVFLFMVIRGIACAVPIGCNRQYVTVFTVGWLSRWLSAEEALPIYSAGWRKDLSTEEADEIELLAFRFRPAWAARNMANPLTFMGFREIMRANLNIARELSREVGHIWPTSVNGMLLFVFYLKISKIRQYSFFII